MPTLKKPATRADELTRVATRIAALKEQRRKKRRELQAIEDEIRIESRTLRGLADQIASAGDELDTPMPIVDAEPERRP